MSRDQQNHPNESILQDNEGQRVSICEVETSMLLAPTAAILSLNTADDDLLLNLDNAFGTAVTEGAIYSSHPMSLGQQNSTSVSDTTSEDATLNDINVPGNGTPIGLYALDDYKCPICLDTFINTVKVDCSYGHKFCNYCITSWISIGRHLITECPVCRGPIFGKTLDLKTDAEIRSLFQRMSDSDKTARLISIKERLQIEYPRVNACLLDFAPSRYMQNSYAEGMSIATGGQYSFQRGYYQHQPYHFHQPQQHHDQHYHHHQLPDNNGNSDMSRDVNNNFTASETLTQSVNHDLFGLYEPTSGTQETSRLPMWMASTSPSPDDVLNHEEPPATAVNQSDRIESAEIRYQHYRYQTQESSRWNNNLYIAPEDNSRRLNDASLWTPNEESTLREANHPEMSRGSDNETTFQSHILNASQETAPVQHNHAGSNYHSSGESNQPHSHSGASYLNGANNDLNYSAAAPPSVQHHQHHSCDQWHYQHHHHFTPVLIPCSPVMPSPAHYTSSCTMAHCYYAPCALHGNSTSHVAHFVPGLVHCHHNPYPQAESNSATHSTGSAPRMRPNIPGRSSIPIQLPTPNVQTSAQRPRTFSSLPNSPTGSPRSQNNDDDRRRRRNHHHHRNMSSNFGGLSPRTYSTGNGIDLSSRSQHSVSSCPVLSHGSHFSGGFSLFSRGYIGFQISHLPAHDRRVVAPPGRITHPLVSLQPLTPDGTSARVTLTFDVHRV